MTGGGASTTNNAASTGTTASSRRSFNTNRTPSAVAHADPVGPSERQGQRHEERGHDQGRPDAFAPVEQHSRASQGDHQHEQTRVGHVVAHGARWPLTEAVVPEDAVLHDPKYRAGGADGDDDRRHRLRALAPRQSVDDRHHEEEQHLLGVDDADAAVERKHDRHHCHRGVDHQRAEEGGRRGSLACDHEQGDPQPEGDREQDLGGGNRDLQGRDETQERGQCRDLQLGGAVVGVREDTHGREILSAFRVGGGGSSGRSLRWSPHR